jgi:hypothetical protein
MYRLRFDQDAIDMSMLTCSGVSGVSGTSGTSGVVEQGSGMVFPKGNLG